MIKNSLFIVLFVVLATSSPFAETPVEKHGWLNTKNGYLLNQNGNIVQLKGMSFFWSKSGWYQGSGIDYFYSETMVNHLVDNWKCNVLRVAFSADSGTCEGEEYVQKVIDAAIKKGVYVIIDWHTHDADKYPNLAIDYFTKQANYYKNTPNVIFEVYNEPITAGSAIDKNGSETNAELTWDAIKPYLTNITKAIRQTGAKNLVILGTPYYCQHTGVVANDPVKDGDKPFENIAYSFHFYAASHGPNARYGEGMEDKYLRKALGLIPIFVTEWGTSHSDGGLNYKEIDPENTQWWIDEFLDSKYHLSSCNWSVSNWQASSAFGSGTTPSASGQIVKNYIGKTPTEFEPEWISGMEGRAKNTVFDMPKTHPAIQFNRYYGTQATAIKVEYKNRDNVDGRSEIVKDSALKITPSVSDNWVYYKIKVSENLKYLSVRYHSLDATGKIELLVDGIKTTEIEIKKNSSWVTVLKEINIAQGEHELRFNFVNTAGTSYYINWFELFKSVEIKRPVLQEINSNVKITVFRNNLDVILPSVHDFLSYSLIGVNGRIIKNGKITGSSSVLKFSNLSDGMCILRLSGPVKSYTYRTVISQNLSPKKK